LSKGEKQARKKKQEQKKRQTSGDGNFRQVFERKTPDEGGKGKKKRQGEAIVNRHPAKGGGKKSNWRPSSKSDQP